MFGAGKTRIGDEFVAQIQNLLNHPDDPFQKYCPVEKSSLPELLEILKKFTHAQSRYYDLTNVSTFREVVSALTRETPRVGLEQEDLQNFFLQQCLRSEIPVFFHFDEIGHFPADDLRRLRAACWEALKHLQKEQLENSFPFFFFSGRGAAYLELGTGGSPVQSHWLILEPLQTSHVLEVLNRSTTSDSLPCFTLVFQKMNVFK